MTVTYATYTLSGPNLISAPPRARERKWIQWSGVEGEGVIDMGRRRSRITVQSWLKAANVAGLWTKAQGLLTNHTTTAASLDLNGHMVRSVLIDDNGIRFGGRFFKRPSGTYALQTTVTFVVPDGL